MSEPRRIQRRRTKGWRMPDGAVYVGRPSVWGNPFRVVRAAGRRGGPLDMWGVEFGGRLLVRWDTRALAAADAVDRFRRWLPPRWAGNAHYELRGRDLACWCPLDQACHGDVLLEAANADVVFAGQDWVLATAARIAREDAELLARLDDGPTGVA